MVFRQSNDKFGWESSFPFLVPIPSYFCQNNNRAQHNSNSPTGFSKLSHGKTHRFWAPGSR